MLDIAGKSQMVHQESIRPVGDIANVRCGQTAGWTKMPLGTEVGLGPGNYVFDGDPAPPSPKKVPAHIYCGLLRSML